ncbi:MAG: hypothetical protein ACLUAL_00220 [Blautia wexlerae]
MLMKIGTDKQLVEMSSGIIENDRVQILAWSSDGNGRKYPQDRPA